MSNTSPRAFLSDYLFALPQYLLPHHLLSLLMLKITRSKIVWFKNRIIEWAIRRYQVDMSLAQEPNPRVYIHFNDFFTRALTPEARPITTETGQIACPVDGAVSQAGPITGDTIFQAKGHDYSLQTLLGGSAEHAARFTDGQFATLYLSPRDYHRIHMPLAGKLLETLHVPGRLFSVNPATARAIPNLFARNERVVTLFETEIGPMALILVGAIFVGSIETVWQGVITPPTRSDIQRWDHSRDEKNLTLHQGQEMGRFNMGSTVIVLFAQGKMNWDEKIKPNANIQMGQLLGNIVESAEQ